MGVLDLPIVANWPRGWIVGPVGLRGASHEPGGQHGDEFDEQLMLREEMCKNGADEMNSSNGSITSASIEQKIERYRPEMKISCQKRLAVLPNTSNGRGNSNCLPPRHAPRATRPSTCLLPAACCNALDLCHNRIGERPTRPEAQSISALR